MHDSVEDVTGCVQVLLLPLQLRGVSTVSDLA
jgi:hypothetical protein